MRRVLFVLAIAACGHSKASGPKWPEPSTTAEDGGQSLEPTPSATYAAAIEKSADASEENKAAAETAATTAAATSEDKSATPTPSSPQTTLDDVFMTEEIIIEIDE